MYLKSHLDYDPGEQKKRPYDWKVDPSDFRFGKIAKNIIHNEMKQVIAPEAIGKRPLETARWAGALDSLGGNALDGLVRTMQQDGVIASFGNAMGNELATSVLPFILRGVRLLGINANSPMPLRTRVWGRIAGDLNPRHAASIATTIGLEDLPHAFDTLIEGRGRGRFVVDLQR